MMLELSMEEANLLKKHYQKEEVRLRAMVDDLDRKDIFWSETAKLAMTECLFEKMDAIEERLSQLRDIVTELESKN